MDTSSDGLYCLSDLSTVNIACDLLIWCVSAQLLPAGVYINVVDLPVSTFTA